jgi:hypothetical protein
MNTTATTDFDDLRRSAFRETCRDGLLEVVIGVLLFIVALAAGRPALYWTFFIAIILLGPGLERLKARITYPRIGFAKLKDEDPRRLRAGMLTWVLGVFAAMAFVLTLTGDVTDNLAWRRAAPALAGLLFAGGFLYLARQSGLTRHYVLTAASILTGLLMVFPLTPEPYGNLRAWALFVGLFALAVGGYTLRRFIRDTPLAQEPSGDGR